MYWFLAARSQPVPGPGWGSPSLIFPSSEISRLPTHSPTCHDLTQPPPSPAGPEGALQNANWTLFLPCFKPSRGFKSQGKPQSLPLPSGPQKAGVGLTIHSSAALDTPPPATLHSSEAPTGLLRCPPSGHSTFPDRLTSLPPPSLQVARHLSQPSDGCPNFGPSKQGGCLSCL